MTTEPQVLQVVSGDGEFNEADVRQFVSAAHIDTAGVDYQTIAITGPQSSGKSTLMNALFGTGFTEMDAMKGRNQTTKGIWFAKSTKITEPVTMVMDLEGSDGRERGEDDTSFERQSSLFALAIADILLVNMWAKDIGREAGSGKPLLKTIFQVNLKLFTPAPNQRRTVLLFVFRDMTKTPLQQLKATWEEDLQRMWQSITKPPHYDAYSFSDFFEVQYAALHNFEDREEDFRADVVTLRRRFTAEGDNSLVRVSQDALPGDAFALSLNKVWEVIKSQKDLNLPAHKVMVANIRCGEILNDQLRALQEDQAWTSLTQAAQHHLVPDFGSQASNLLESCLTGYEQEARYFEAGVRQSKQEELHSKLASMVREVFQQQLGHVHKKLLQAFKGDLGGSIMDKTQPFAEAADRWSSQAEQEFRQGTHDHLTVKGVDCEDLIQEGLEALMQEVHSWVEHLRQDKIKEIMTAAEQAMQSQLAGPTIALLDDMPADLWTRLSNRLSSSTAAAAQVLTEGLEGYSVSEHERLQQREELQQSGRHRVEGLVQQAADTALSRMKDRFNDVFARDEQHMPRNWSPSANIPAIAQQARQSAARLLALLAVIRLHAVKGAEDKVERALLSLAADRRPVQGSGEDDRASHSAEWDTLAAPQWPGVPEKAMLLSPSRSRALWRQFTSDTNFMVQQAVNTQEANKAASNRLPPLWAMVAMVLLGWNEAMSILTSPLKLVLLVVGLLFAKTVYQELEVDTEMQHGLLPGCLALAAKFVPTMKQVARRTGEQCMSFVHDPNQLRETVQHQVEAVVHQADGLLHSPRKSTRDIQMTSVKSGTLDSASSNNLRHREISSKQSNLDASVPHTDTSTLSDSFKSK
ncbi:hypothetical protein WJX79_008695 [Trebouxia sp. C0005]